MIRFNQTMKLLNHHKLLLLHGSNVISVVNTRTVNEYHKMLQSV